MAFVFGGATTVICMDISSFSSGLLSATHRFCSCLDRSVMPCLYFIFFPIPSWSCSASDLKEVRLIVYQDCERRGREVLFDSTAVHKIDGATFQVWNLWPGALLPTEKPSVSLEYRLSCFCFTLPKNYWGVVLHPFFRHLSWRLCCACGFSSPG